MKKFSAFCLVLAFFVPLLLNAQYPFQKDLGDIGTFETGSSLAPLPTGNFLLTGERLIGSDNQAMLTEIDPNGNVIRTTVYLGGNGVSCHGKDVIPEPQGAVCIAGKSNPSFTAQLGNPFLIQTTLSGSIQWVGNYGTPNADEGFNAVTQAWIYGYVATGYADGFNTTANSKDILVALVSNNVGSMQWANAYGGTEDDEGLDIIEDAPGKYVIAGRSRSFNNGAQQDIYVLCVDSLGNQLWSLVVDGGGDETAYAIIKDGSGFALTGSTNSFSPNGTTRPFLLKLDSAGVLVSFQTYETPSTEVVGYDLQKTANGYVVSGTVQYQHPFLLFLDPAGTATRMVQYGYGDDIKKFAPLSNVSGGGFMGVGTRGIATGVGPDIFLIRTDSLGATANSCADTTYTPASVMQTPNSFDPQETLNAYTPSAFVNITVDSVTIGENVRCGGMTHREPQSEMLENWTVFPNPFQEALTVQLGLRQRGTVRLEVQNALGQSTGIRIIRDLSAGSPSLQVSTSGLVPGLYLVQLEIKGEIHTGKLIKH